MRYFSHLQATVLYLLLQGANHTVYSKARPVSEQQGTKLTPAELRRLIIISGIDARHDNDDEAPRLPPPDLTERSAAPVVGFATGTTPSLTGNPLPRMAGFAANYLPDDGDDARRFDRAGCTLAGWVIKHRLNSSPLRNG